MHVNVVKSLSLTGDSVLVKAFNIVLLPTEGNPNKATRASPCLTTSNPSPLSPTFLGGSNNWLRNFANLAFIIPK